MYYLDLGIVLRYRDINENDRIVTVFTKNYGRVEILFKGVKKTEAKLRGISEFFTYSAFRLYMKKYGAIPLCIGGNIIDSYPEIRSDFKKIYTMMLLSSVVISLTPLFQKSEEKFELLLSSLNYLRNNSSISDWFVVVFIANLLNYCGIGFKETNIGYDSNFWSILHSSDFLGIDELKKYDDIKYEVLEIFINKINENFNQNYRIDNFIKILEAV
jgi:DNA repair protein RecO (recombination protein O)